MDLLAAPNHIQNHTKKIIVNFLHAAWRDFSTFLKALKK
jgi:hypothetical protein